MKIKKLLEIKNKKSNKNVLIDKNLLKLLVIALIIVLVAEQGVVWFSNEKIAQSKIKDNNLMKSLSDLIVQECKDEYERNVDSIVTGRKVINANKTELIPLDDDEIQMYQNWYKEDLRNCEIWAIDAWVTNNIEYYSNIDWTSENNDSSNITYNKTVEYYYNLAVNRLYLDIDVYKILEDGKGDCRATAILRASLINQQNITTYFAWEKNHMCLFVDKTTDDNKYPYTANMELESINCFNDKFYSLSSTMEIE